MKIIPSWFDVSELQQYPAEQRFRVYRQAHRDLMTSDPVYRRRVICLRLFTIVSSVVGYVGTSIVMMTSPLFSDPGPQFQTLAWGQVLPMVLPMFCAGITVTLLAIQQQRFQNHRISQHLTTGTAATRASQHPLAPTARLVVTDLHG